MDADKLLANFNLVIAAPGGVARVREMILQLAVRGLLVPQDPNDRPAAISLGKTKREKVKIKAANPMPPVDAQSAPYSLPQNWKWMRIGDIGSVVGGGTPKTSILEYWEGDEMFSWITPADMNKQSRYVEKGRRGISRAGLENSSANILPVGSVVFSIRAPIGYVGIVSNPLATNQGIKSCVPHIKRMSDYIWLFLKAFAPSIDAAASGTTFRELSGKKFSLIPIAVPPLAEQRRIVAKVDELMSLCDELDEKKQRRNNTHKALQSSALNTLATATTPAATAKAWTRIRDHWPTLLSTPESIATLRQTILQLATRGQLVPQNPNDGDGAEILNMDRCRRNNISNMPPLANNLPSLPSGWCWVRLADLADLNIGRTPDTRNHSYWGAPGFEWVSIADMVHRGTLYETKKKVSALAKTEVFRRAPESAGTLLMSYKLTIGKISLLGVPAYHNEAIAAIKPDNQDTRKYLLKALPVFASQGNISNAIKGRTLNKKTLSALPIALPPLAEQKRIAAKIDELMSLCDALESRIGVQSSASRDLARALSAPP